MVGGQVFAKHGHQAASREDPANVVDAGRMVGEVVSDDPVSSANGERKRDWNLLTWRQPLLNSVYPSCNQIVLRACDADLFDAVLYKNDVPNHRTARAEFPYPVPDRYGLATLREEQSRENLRIQGGGVSLIGAFEEHLDGWLLGIPSQRYAGRIDVDIDPSPTVLDERRLSDVGLTPSLVEAKYDAYGSEGGKHQRDPSDPVNAIAGFEVPVPIRLLCGTVLLLSGVLLLRGGVRRNAGLVVIAGWLLTFFSGALLIPCLTYL